MGSIQKPTKILIVGGAYAGLACGLNLFDLCQGRAARFSSRDAEKESDEKDDLLGVKSEVEIRVVDERDGYYHLIGTPLALSSKSYYEKAWRTYDSIPALREQAISWTQGSVQKIDPSTKTATILDTKSGKEVEEEYDYLVAASGLSRAWPTVPQSLTGKSYLKEAGTHIDKVVGAKEGVVVIGGGAVGVEMAAELKYTHPSQTVTLIHSHTHLLSAEPLPDEFKEKALEVLKEGGVETIMGQRVMETRPVKEVGSAESFELTLSDGRIIKAGEVIWAVSKSVPTSGYLPKETLNEEGLVKIGSNLNLTADISNRTFHFAVGDIAAWSGIKRCGAAMHAGYLAAVNIHQRMLESQLGRTPKFVELPEVPPMIALAIGNNAVLYGPNEGVQSGEEIMKSFFGNDLGFDICWNYLQLGKDTTIDEPIGQGEVLEKSIEKIELESPGRVEIEV
ncbi:hypothetical protein BGZ60DRAFT_474017 [Tricladium varicosporioides]|nr:hypothetical protein BGZ60DRAFT_474017 [Hymenoscyphus varicosporioides]